MPDNGRRSVKRLYYDEIGDTSSDDDDGRESPVVPKRRRESERERPSEESDKNESNQVSQSSQNQSASVRANYNNETLTSNYSENDDDGYVPLPVQRPVPPGYRRYAYEFLSQRYRLCPSPQWNPRLLSFIRGLRPNYTLPYSIPSNMNQYMGSNLYCAMIERIVLRNSGELIVQEFNRVVYNGAELYYITEDSYSMRTRQRLY